MCDDDIHPGLVQTSALSRRAFGAVALASAGIAATAHAQAAVTQTDVEVKTADGTADAVLIQPQAKGTYPAVLVWPDIMGLRPAFREMGARLAAQGYVVLVPNPFYRSKRAPVLEGNINFGDPATRQILNGYRAAITPEGAAADSVAYLKFLDAQPKTATRRKAGVQGYCMGGGLSFRTAAAVPDRIGAVGSFHGGNGLVAKDDPASPHLLIPKTRAEFLVAHAKNDDEQSPAMKDELKAAFAAAGRKATVEVYPANHGWCVPGSAVYDSASAERAWSELSNLYRRALV
jgi:carboxymethylenebutenolidase